MANDPKRVEDYLDSPIQARGSHAGHAAPVQETMSIFLPRYAHSEPEAEVVRRFLPEVADQWRTLLTGSNPVPTNNICHALGYPRGYAGRCGPKAEPRRRRRRV